MEISDTRRSLLDRVEKINVWTRGSERAPHKPLLLLYALGRLSRGEPPEVSFAELEPQLKRLLAEFGPSRRAYHPEYPFWRLQNDGLWKVGSREPMRPRASNSDPPKSELLEKGARGRLLPDDQASLEAHPEFVSEVARRLLEAHFPDTIHSDILDAVGLSIDSEGLPPRRRDPGFRQRILTAYEYRCAVCAFDARIGTVPVALEAAHVKWHQAGGPDTEPNGVAMCSLHHKLFDLGAFTIHTDRSVLVSEETHGSGEFEHALLRHHGRSMSSPQRPEHSPAPVFLAWHRKQVFKGRPRHLP